jgi:hypothetical protein
MKQLLQFSLFILIISCSGPKYLSLKPVDEAITKWTIPNEIISQNDIFKNAEGIQVWNYSIRIDLGNSSEVLCVRYDLEANEDSYKKIVSNIYPDANFEDGPNLNLPNPSKTYKVDASKFLGIEAEGFIAIVPHPHKGLLGIAFTGSNFVDQQYVIDVISSIAYKGIPSKIITETFPDSINLADFKFERNKDYCKWMGPRNLACYPNGQINWSYHNSPENAARAVDQQIAISQSRGGEIFRDDSIKIVFAGQKLKARRILYSLSYSLIPTFPFSLMSKTNDFLIAFYVHTKLNNKYVHWVGSFFSNQVYPGNLAPLISEVVEYEDPLFMRVFCKNELPDTNSLKLYLKEKTMLDVKIKKEIVDKNTYNLLLNFNKYIDPIKLVVFETIESETLNETQHFLNKISRYENNEKVTRHLNQSKFLIKYNRSKSTDKQGWQVLTKTFDYFLQKSNGIEQLDNAGFYENDKLIFRL